MAVTTAEIEAKRDEAKLAYENALNAYSYTMNMGGTSRSKTNQNIQTLFDIYMQWQSMLEQSDGSTRRVKFGRAQI